MAGIRVKNPIGPGWEYSIDTRTWQSSPVFTELAPGVPLVVGETYIVQCRNLEQTLFSLAAIKVGEADNKPGKYIAPSPEELTALASRLAEIFGFVLGTVPGENGEPTNPTGALSLSQIFTAIEQRYGFVLGDPGTGGGTPTNPTDTLTMQILAQRGISVLAAQLIYQSIASLIPAAPTYRVPTLDEVCSVMIASNETRQGITAAYLTTPRRDPLYELHGIMAWLDTVNHDGVTPEQTAMRITFERLAEYIVDRMSEPWQGILVERLYPKIKARLIADGFCVNCGEATVTLNYVRILDGAVQIPEGQSAQFRGRAYFSDSTEADITEGIWVVVGDGATTDQTGKVTVATNTTRNDTRPGTLKLYWNGKSYAKGFEIVDTTALPPATETFDGHWVEVADAPTAPQHQYVGGFDINDCDKITGWGGDKASPNTPVTSVIRCDGQEVGRVTSQLRRTDVRNYLTAQGLSVTYENFGFQFIKPAQFRDGKPHTWSVHSVDGAVEYEVNVNKTITCAAPNSGPYPTGEYSVDGSEIVPEGGDATVRTLKQHLSDGSKRTFPDAVSVAINGNVPGLTLSSANSASVSVQLGANTINNDVYVGLVFSFGSTTVNARLQLINAGCTRPAQALTPRLVWNFVPTGQGARSFSTLDDAINTMGAYFASGGTTGQYSAFHAQFNDYNVGTPGYLGTDGSCAMVSDNIYYVLNGDDVNGQLIAIQTANGYIVDAKPVPTEPILPANTTQYVQYRFIKGGGSGSSDLLEVQMKDTYPESLMFISLVLASGTYALNESYTRTLPDSTPRQDKLRARIYNTGAYGGKTLKLGISTVQGNTPNLHDITITVPATSTSGFINLYPGS